MSTAITFENLNTIYLRPRLDYSSDSFVEPVDKVEEQVINSELVALKEDIGENLFDQLSYDDKIFMIETSDSIDFGHPIDLDKIAQDIRDYDDY